MSEELSNEEIAELKENLRLSTWERFLKNDRKLNEYLEREEFVEKLRRGLKFISPSNVHLS